MSVEQNYLNGALQENVLTLLCFDDQSAGTVASTIDVGLFDNAIYRRIAESAVNFYNKYKKAPKEHIADLLESKLKNKEKDSKLYVRSLRDLKALSKTLNKEFVLGELDKFVRQQTLRQSIVEAAEFIQGGNVDEAEKAIAKGFYSRKQTRRKGIYLYEAPGKIKGFSPEDYIFTGVEVLDKAYICPARKELFTIIGAPNRGKTWALIHIGKTAAVQRYNVLHVTLEMSQQKIAGRYLQSFFAMSRRELDSISTTRFVLDEKHNFTSLELKTLPKRPFLESAETLKSVEAKLKKMKGRAKVLIQEFPTDSLTIEAFEAYLETLAAEERFFPDIVVMDYADLMRISATNLRIETQKIWKGLRRIAVERNFAMVTASQSNREGEEARLLTMKHFAEDYSKAGISDIILSLNQTQQEKELSLARLFSLKVRDESGGMIAVLSQAYPIGQFCLNSVRIRQKPYWDAIDKHADQMPRKRHAHKQRRSK